MNEEDIRRELAKRSVDLVDVHTVLNNVNTSQADVIIAIVQILTDAKLISDKQFDVIKPKLLDMLNRLDASGDVAVEKLKDAEGKS